MTQYELIQTYPDSPTMGTIHTSGIGICKDWKGTIFYDANPKYWKKVEMLDYEIINYRNYNGEIFEYFYNGYAVNSVKRLSDGEVFTIGDLIDFGDFGNKGNQLINKIDVDIFDKTRITAWNCAYGLGLIKWKKAKVKTPLFTTEDGVGVFEGDKLYYVLKSFEIHCNPANKSDGTNKDYKYFSTEEKAKEYILLNKPVLSFSDVIKQLNGLASASAILELAKSKL